jgi:hypothetical protein
MIGHKRRILLIKRNALGKRGAIEKGGRYIWYQQNFKEIYLIRN